MELDGEVEEEEKHGDRIPELAKDRKGEAKAVARKAEAALTVKVVRKLTRSSTSKICPCGAPHVPGKGLSSGGMRGFRKQGMESCRRKELVITIG